MKLRLYVYRQDGKGGYKPSDPVLVAATATPHQIHVTMPDGAELRLNRWAAHRVEQTRWRRWPKVSAAERYFLLFERTL